MEQISKKKEVWPVMLTPFTDSGEVDYHALDALIDWYEAAGVDGLFAVCQSSEMFYLSLRERVELAAHIKRRAKVPVIASGHVSSGREDQLEELRRVADTGVDALVLLTNRMATEDADSAAWIGGLAWLLDRLPSEIPLGLYECPHPYKKLLTEEELTFCLNSGRFRFLKDTCCDIDRIRERTRLLAGSSFGLYNANTATCLDSLRSGAAGFSGVMANFHPALYVWLCRNWETAPEKAERLQAALTVCSFSESRPYPVTAKYYLGEKGLPIGCNTRSRRSTELTDLVKSEIMQMGALAEFVAEALEL
ncbi:MAG: dihydrodipicolinate synthase family protein [Oscillospiraceae bacterium]